MGNEKIAPTYHSGSITAVLFVAIMVTFAPRSSAQTYRVLHTFTGGADGASPASLLSLDAGGNLYGTTFAGGDSLCVNRSITNPCGTVFELTHKGSSWAFGTLYEFSGTNGDGAGPAHNGVVFGPDGALFGTTTYGGSEPGQNGNGTVFRLMPQATFCRAVSCPWRETVLYRFQAGSDGMYPEGNVLFDEAGNLYGVTFQGGGSGNCSAGCGAVYKLSPSSGGWTETIAYGFSGPPNGDNPDDSLIMDNAGDLYGTTVSGGSSGIYGEAFELKASGSGWTENHLHDFQGGDDGASPVASLIFDGIGNLYGDSYLDGYLHGQGGAGTVFELMPSGGGWSYSTLVAFNGGAGVPGRLVMDGAGSLYGTTAGSGRYNLGSVFRLTPSDGGWTLTDLYDFTGGSDGEVPYNGLALDANGNLYGTTWQGGGCSLASYGCGVVFEITP